MKTSVRGAVLGGLAVVAVISMGATEVAIRGAALAPHPRAAVSTPAPTPFLSSAPKALKAGDAPQALTIAGRDLSAGMTATVEMPDGWMVTYGTSVIDAVTPTSFRLRFPLEQPGTYRLNVHNRLGERSNDITFTVSR